MSRRGALAGILAGMALLAGQGYRDSILIAGMRAQVAEARHEAADARAAQGTAEGHEAEVVAAGRDVLKGVRELRTAADRCRM